MIDAGTIHLSLPQTASGEVCPGRRAATEDDADQDASCATAAADAVIDPISVPSRMPTGWTDTRTRYRPTIYENQEYVDLRPLVPTVAA